MMCLVKYICDTYLFQARLVSCIISNEINARAEIGAIARLAFRTEQFRLSI